MAVTVDKPTSALGKSVRVSSGMGVLGLLDGVMR